MKINVPNKIIEKYNLKENDLIKVSVDTDKHTIKVLEVLSPPLSEK